MNLDTDLLIIGAGPTGLAAGVDALRHGLTVRLVEQRTERAMLSKALVVHARTMEVFEAQGIARQVEAKGQKFRALNVRPVRDMRPIRIDLLERPWGDTRYGCWLSAPQYDVEQVLEERFTSLGGRVEWGRALEALVQHDDHVEATVGGQVHRARWVLACDGGRSTARGLVGLELPREGLGVTFALTDVWTKSDLVEDEGNVVLGRDGVLLIVPMPEPGVWRLIAQVRPDFDPASLDAWAALVRERAGFDLQLQKLGWNSRFDLTGGVATAFRKDRVFLLGDAAHVHSPVGGQGLNTGVQDANNLVWKLALVTRGVVQGADADRLLDSYERERRPIAQNMVRMTTFATRVLTLKNAVLRFVRSTLGRLVVRTPLFQNQLSRRVGMLDLENAGNRRLENPALPDGRRLHDVLHPLKPTLLSWQGRQVLVRPDRIIASDALVSDAIAERVEVR
ncbi:MAG: FAD-dependent monooxygenase [Myxococcaceae bacterium]